jgi:hypothetical protein
LLEIHERVKDSTEDCAAIRVVFEALGSGITEDMLVGVQDNGK